MAAPVLPATLKENRSDEREVFELVNAIRRLLTTTDGLTAILDMLSSTRGSVLYRGANGWAALPPGTVGQVLTSGGAGADPLWA